jgi:hypothetical protein
MNIKSWYLGLEDTKRLLISAMNVMEDEELEVVDDFALGKIFDRIDEAIEKLSNVIEDIEWELAE